MRELRIIQYECVRARIMLSGNANSLSEYHRDFATKVASVLIEDGEIEDGYFDLVLAFPKVGPDAPEDEIDVTIVCL